VLTADAWGIAGAIVLWVAGFTGILVATAPEETRALWRWSTLPGRRPDPRRFFADLSDPDGDVVDSRHELKRAAGPARDQPSESADVRQPTRVLPGRSTMATDAPHQAIDPLAQQAALLLSEAIVTSPDRALLWKRFHELVVVTVGELEEAPVREAIDEIERRGLRLDVVARVVQQRLSE
jgi:hypothetical protein